MWQEKSMQDEKDVVMIKGKYLRFNMVGVQVLYLPLNSIFSHCFQSTS